MIGDIYELEDLKQITGYERSGDIKTNLEKQGITIFVGKDGRIFTTKGLIEAAGSSAGNLQNLKAQDIL